MENTLNFNSACEMYQGDLEELEKFISQSIRPNIKRQLEEYKRNLNNLLEEEKKKLEKLKQASENTKNNCSTNSSTSTMTNSSSEVKFHKEN